MNPLQEHPHLFAGGKFKVQIHYGKNNKPILNLNHRTLPDVVNHPEHCTLIARGISDMSEKEIAECFGEDYGKLRKSDIDYYRYQLIDNQVYANHLTYLLSVGVYPFDQKVFNNGAVISAVKGNSLTTITK